MFDLAHITFLLKFQPDVANCLKRVLQVKKKYIYKVTLVFQTYIFFVSYIFTCAVTQIININKSYFWRYFLINKFFFNLACDK